MPCDGPSVSGRAPTCSTAPQPPRWTFSLREARRSTGGRWADEYDCRSPRARTSFRVQNGLAPSVTLPLALRSPTHQSDGRVRVARVARQVPAESCARCPKRNSTGSIFPPMSGHGPSASYIARRRGRFAGHWPASDSVKSPIVLIREDLRSPSEPRSGSRASARSELDPVRHSHTTTTRQPRVSSARTAAASRATLALNFVRQNSRRVFGVVVLLHPRCRCQKQPWTKTTVRCLLSTRSGEPGRRPIVKTKPVAGPVKETANRELRAGIPTADPSHDFAA